jgi:hypothetical protein
LIAKAKAGDANAWSELIVLDINFDQDWWNTSVFEEGLDIDLKLAARQLGEKDPRYQHLATYAKLARQEETKPETIRQTLIDAKLVVGTGATLPESSHLARALLELVVGAEAETAGNLWAAHAATLHARVEKHDRDALHALCWLAMEADNGEIEPLARLGWKDWKDPEFAVSYLRDLYKKKNLAQIDPELTAALAMLPEDTDLNHLRLGFAGESGVTQAMIVAAIKAEYRKLSEDSYTLNALFAELQEKLEGLPEPKPSKHEAPVEWEGDMPGMRSGESPSKPSQK